VDQCLNLLAKDFNGQQMRAVESALHTALHGYTVTKEVTETALSSDINPDVQAYQMFFVAKRVEGLSENTLKVYAYTYNKFFRIIQKPISAITTNDVRYYLATRQGVKPTTIDNERRNLNTLFSWLEQEEYITRNPMRRIKKIKQGRVVRMPFSATEIEELRDACLNERERAIVEVLLSTGMRVGELCGLNKSDIDHYSGEALVTGKGNKQRICYLNAIARKRIKDYLDTRTDDWAALIVADKNGKGNTRKGGYRLGLGRIEALVREIGRRAGVSSTHPHRFRRTAASMALQRGMPIDQVRIMLGHESMETTLRYAITSDETVKQSHSKYM